MILRIVQSTLSHTEILRPSLKPETLSRRKSFNPFVQEEIETFGRFYNTLVGIG